MPTAITITLNGEPHELAADTDLVSLVESLGRDPRTVAVERNGEIVPRAGFAETHITAGDRLEVVSFVQGG